MSDVTKHWSIKTALEQIEKCAFECEGGALKNNAAWRWLTDAAAMSNLPGYDAWKTDAPDWKPGEESAHIAKNEEQRQNFRDALEALIADERADLYLSELWDIARDVLVKAPRNPGEPEWQTKVERWPTPDVAGETTAALKASYAVLAFAFHRIHALPRTRDSELASDIAKVRARIEGAIARAEGATP